jgi:hypothetical protein
MSTKSTSSKALQKKPVPGSEQRTEEPRSLPPIDERAVRSLDLGEAFDDELDPLGASAAPGARPPNRYEARPPNRYEARPPNRYEHRTSIVGQ